MTDCEYCGDPWPSMKAALLCEDRDRAEDREARRPTRRVMRPAREWQDD